jgi:AraC-like DNA-binding protein
VLHLVSNTSFQYIASAQYKPIKGTENQQRINQVFQYVQKEFTHQVSLEKAAALIHLSESAFCKFFKRTSGKTFSDYTNDIRIAHACYLLIETDKPVNVIATESGFESLTYFNRIFLKKKKLKPRDYRKL